MTTRNKSVAQGIIRRNLNGEVSILTYEHDKWMNPQGRSYRTLPGKKTDVRRSLTEQPVSIDEYVGVLAQEDLGLHEGEYWFDQELLPTTVTMDSPTHNVPTHYTLYPITIGIVPEQLDRVTNRLNGRWLTPRQIIQDESTSPTARAVVSALQRRDSELDARYQANPTDERKPGAAKRLFCEVPTAPSADALTRGWAIRNRGDVRVLRHSEIRCMLDAAQRAFNPLVADPYLWYQRQGLGVTWAFFSHRDRQDLHVHPLGVTEFYGIVEGELEIWWRPYHASGASAWNHRILCAGDWAEVSSLQWHIVHWLSDGYGVVFKAGPGPLAGVGRLGTAGKTNWDDSHGILPCEVRELMERLR